MFKKFLLLAVLLLLVWGNQSWADEMTKGEPALYSEGIWTEEQNSVFWTANGCTVIVSLYNSERLGAVQMVLSFDKAQDVQKALSPFLRVSQQNQQDVECLEARWVQDAAEVKGEEEGSGWSILDINNEKKTILVVLIPINGIQPDLRPILFLKFTGPVVIREGKVELPNGVVHQGIKIVIAGVETRKAKLSAFQYLNLELDEPARPAELKSGSQPIQFTLYPNSPNPFNLVTVISFTLPVATPYRLTIYNVTGQQVKSYEGIGNVGLNEIIWDSKDNSGNEFSSGVYFYKLSAGNYTATEKMLLLK